MGLIEKEALGTYASLMTEEAEALADFLEDRGIPEADDPLPGEYHYVFFAGA